MIKNILKKDLKRKKTMNIILLMFIALATMFVASSVNNIVAVMNGTGYYFEQAGLGDYLVITMGENVVGNLEEPLKNELAVEDFMLETVIFTGKNSFFMDGEQLDGGNNAMLLQSLDDAKMSFFDADDNKVDTVEPGKIYVTAKYMKTNNLKAGDKITVKVGNVEETFELVGKLKDALLGSNFMGNTRVLMSHDDFAKFAVDEEYMSKHGGEIGYIHTQDDKAVEKCLSEVSGVSLNKPISIITMCYVMDMVVAGVLIVLSVCLIIVSFVVLKFTITFTLEEEFREIGVMKAIGIKDKKIRNIYLIKYMALAIVGALIGFVGSVPFANMLLASVSENMMLGNNNGILLNVLSTIFVVLVIIGYAYRCTGKLKKYSPIDAIRSGQTGERYKKKSTYRIGKSHLKPVNYMALNDVISSPKRYLTIILAFAICSTLVFMIVNTTETVQSDNLAYTFSKPADVYYDDVNKVMANMSGEGHIGIENVLTDLENELKEHDLDVNAFIDVQFTLKVEFNDEVYKIVAQQGIRTKAGDYKYLEGDAPSNAHEIAITRQVSETTGAKIGDSLKLTISGKTEEYLVTAYFQTFNQMGEMIRIHEDVPTNMSESSSAMSFQFDFTDSPSAKEIDARIEKMKDIFETDSIYNAKENTAESMGVADTMKAVELLLLAITLVVVILVTILMERSFISDEKGEIAILKAIGFSDKSIVSWHTRRFAVVGFVAVAISVIISVPMTKLCITPIFGIMGLEQVDYSYNLLQVLVIFPVIILAVTILTANITARYTKSIQCRDTASIE